MNVQDDHCLGTVWRDKSHTASLEEMLALWALKVGSWAQHKVTGKLYLIVGARLTPISRYNFEALIGDDEAYHEVKPILRLTCLPKGRTDLVELDTDLLLPVEARKLT